MRTGWPHFFASHALVQDEGGRHEGVQAIRAWRLAAKQKYQYVTEPIEANTRGDQVSVKARVTGRFPNSPVTLSYTFKVEHGRIVALKIA